MNTSLAESLLVGESSAMRELRAIVATVAPTRLPVLIEGETGTGKELVATLLHHLSGRSGALVAFNVCSLSDSMFEDALFGHVRGAFTGAAGESLGFLREANGGTVFLDEITGLPLGLQPKLLRAIETGVFRPIGDGRDTRSDFRTIAATNERLDDLVEGRRFRADLSHRLRGVVIQVPTLNQRPDDIPLLVEHFLRRMAPQETVVVTREASELLRERVWPGNVRELKQVVEAATVLGRNVLDKHSLTMALAGRSSVVANTGFGAVLSDRRDVLLALQNAEWDADRAAERLGIHRATLYRRMKRLGIDPSARHGRPVPVLGSQTVTSLIIGPSSVMAPTTPLASS
jgi:DNA-binding NtrC family response regulator